MLIQWERDPKLREIYDRWLENGIDKDEAFKYLQQFGGRPDVEYLPYIDKYTEEAYAFVQGKSDEELLSPRQLEVLETDPYLRDAFIGSEIDKKFKTLVEQGGMISQGTYDIVWPGNSGADLYYMIRRIKMEQKVTDIGTLEFYQGEYGGKFTVKKFIKLFSQSYEIQIRFNVYNDGFEGLTDEMVMAAKACLDAINNQADKIEQAIKNFYDTDIKCTIEDEDGDYMEIDNISQLAQVMQPKELYVTDFKVGLYFECDWDEEKGFGIKFDKDGNVIKMGTGGVVY